MSEEKYLILPGCDDSNRGNQALIWETVELARAAGYIGDYYMLASKENCIQSSKKEIQNVEPILSHPSAHFKTSMMHPKYRTVSLRMLFRECSCKNAGVAGYAEAFTTVLSGKQTSET